MLLLEYWLCPHPLSHDIGPVLLKLLKCSEWEKGSEMASLDLVEASPAVDTLSSVGIIIVIRSLKGTGTLLYALGGSVGRKGELCFLVYSQLLSLKVQGKGNIYHAPWTLHPQYFYLQQCFLMAWP